MRAVRTYCLAEYQRRWGKPWDGSLRKTRDQILALRVAARRGQKVWKKLRDAIEETNNFVSKHGLDITKAADLLKLVGTVPYEAIALHGWLQRNKKPIVALLELQFDPILSIRSEFATGLELQRIEEPPAPGVIRQNYDGRPLNEEEMAIVSLLAGSEPSGLREKLRNEVLSIEYVITQEREAINTALHRYGESKKVAREQGAEAAAQRGAAPDEEATRSGPGKTKKRGRT
jgi:hypothetical protein